jgi:trypsin-like peptidase
MLVSRFGYIVTNHHVIAGGEARGRIQGMPAQITISVQRVEVRLSTTGQSERSGGGFEASVLATDPDLDLAILTIPGNDFPYIPLGDSDSIETGRPVSVIGFPLGDALEIGRSSSDEPTAPAMTAGIVSAIRRDAQGNVRYVQTSAAVNPGNSGGPLVDRHGCAAGVIQMRASRAEGIGFAIPINLVKGFLGRNGVDGFLPATALTPGHYYDSAEKRLRFQAPSGFDDKGPSRLGVDSGATLTGLSLRIDRVAASTSLDRISRRRLHGVVPNGSTRGRQRSGAGGGALRGPRWNRRGEWIPLHVLEVRR